MPCPSSLPALTSWHLPALLDEAAASHGERPFIIGKQEITYAEAARQTRVIAGRLAEAKVGRGDRVLMVCQNRLEMVLLAFATLRLGAVFVILSPQMKPEGFRKIFDQCEPKLVMLDAGTSSLRGETGSTSLIVPDEVEETVEWARRFSELLAGEPLAAEFPGIDQDPAFLVFTSGSTGTPRGVILSHDNVRYATAGIQQRLGYEATDRIGVFLPLSFDYGLYQLFLAAQAGAAVFLGQPEMTGPELPAILADNGITVLPGVPTVFGGLLKMLSWRKRPLPALRMATNTGDHLPQAYIRKLQELLPAVQIYPMYGLTECKRVSILLPEEYEQRPDSVGRALDGTEVFTVDAEGNRLPPGEVGELVVRGRTLALGYWRADEETAKRYRRIGPGRARTMFSGDLCKVDAEGFITFHGRGDFIIKHKGHRMSPLEIEEVACQMPGIAAAGAVKDETGGLLHLFLAVTQDEVSTEAVIEWLNERLERVKVPERIHFIPELPKTANQKVDRKALRALLPTA
ncbi:MAG: hypothetical protein JWO08_2932 [Verrucomicrobiaceae bacterium]|nr:hypothetical protein [Verrucomicrobiaceae bacterium]